MTFMLGAKETGSVNIRSIALPFHSFTGLESEKNAKILCQLLLRLDNLDKLMLARVPGDPQHKNNGFPLEFFDHRTKDTLESDPIPPPLFTPGPGPFSLLYAMPFLAEDDPKFLELLPKDRTRRMELFPCTHPFMKPLEKVVFGFRKGKDGWSTQSIFKQTYAHEGQRA
jgi:hypothetical protein